jgi:hypothetical protein
MRIGWSALCGIVCAMLVVLWMRSFFRAEYFERVVDVKPLYGMGNRERILNCTGSLEFTKEPVINAHIHCLPSGWQFQHYNSAKGIREVNWLRFQWQSVPKYQVVRFPHWFPVLVIGIVGMLPWIYNRPWLPHRFSLRTLLIATTLVAVVLGLIVAFGR